MGPIPFPSEKQLWALLVLAFTGAGAILAGAVAALAWVVGHLRWVP